MAKTVIKTTFAYRENVTRTHELTVDGDSFNREDVRSMVSGSPTDLTDGFSCVITHDTSTVNLTHTGKAWKVTGLPKVKTIDKTGLPKSDKGTYQRDVDFANAVKSILTVFYPKLKERSRTGLTKAELIAKVAALEAQLNNGK